MRGEICIPIGDRRTKMSNSEIIVKMGKRIRLKGGSYVRDLIRCKDCKYFTSVNNTPSKCASTGLDVTGDDYCSYAEER